VGDGGEVSGEPELFNTTLFGPTCDSLDFICKNTPLPRLEVGDKIMVKNMGAYSVASATEFNGFPIPERRYVGITV
jgi:ornithine decarboxylase